MASIIDYALLKYLFVIHLHNDTTNLGRYVFIYFHILL